MCKFLRNKVPFGKTTWFWGRFLLVLFQEFSMDPWAWQLSIRLPNSEATNFMGGVRVNVSLSITATRATAESSPRRFFAEHAYVPPSAFVTLSMLTFPSITVVFPLGKWPNAFRHVTVGIGWPEALHTRVTFSPSSTITEEGFCVINAATAIKKHERTYHPITLSTHEEFSVS